MKCGHDLPARVVIYVPYSVLKEKAFLVNRWAHGAAMTRYNDTANQQRIATAAAAIVNRATYDAMPDSTKKALRVAWQAQLRAQTGCTERTARKHIWKLCGDSAKP